MRLNAVLLGYNIRSVPINLPEGQSALTTLLSHKAESSPTCVDSGAATYAKEGVHRAQETGEVRISTLRGGEQSHIPEPIREQGQSRARSIDLVRIGHKQKKAITL